jgi:hypothetical protein
MTKPVLCAHPTPNGPCTRKVIPGAGGCGFHPAPPDPPEDRTPEPMQTCQCDRPMVLGRADAVEVVRCFLCTRPVEALLEAEGGPGMVEEPMHNGDDPERAHNELVLRLLGQHPQEGDE